MLILKIKKIIAIFLFVLKICCYKKNFADVFTNLKNLFETYPGIAKLWIGPHLYVIDSRPEDMNILLNGCLGKAGLYDVLAFALKDGLVTGPGKLILQFWECVIMCGFYFRHQY